MTANIQSVLQMKALGRRDDTDAGRDVMRPVGARVRRPRVHRVGQIKRGHCAFLLVTNECIYQNL